MGKKKGFIPPPRLPPDEEVDVSDEDVRFFQEDKQAAKIIEYIDTEALTKQVSQSHQQVDPVDALPIKTLDGQLQSGTAALKRPVNATKEDEQGSADDNDDGVNITSVVRLAKPEKRAKMKKTRKEAKKKQRKETVNADEVEAEADPQAQALADVKEEFSAKEVLLSKKSKLAELGTALLTDPETNIKSLKEMVQLSKDENQEIVKLGLLSLLTVFKDIIPGYRIRFPTGMELEMNVSKEVKKIRFYESTLLTSYKVYLQRLIVLQKESSFQHVAVRCMCSLLDAVPHFNFRENLLKDVVNNMSSTDDVIRNLCCTAIKSLFLNEGKHGGEATVEAVHLIANLVKLYECRLHPDTVEVFLSLAFSEDIGKTDMSKRGRKVGKREKRRMKKAEGSTKPQVNNKKRSRQDLKRKTREEVDADLKVVSFAPDVLERRKMQSNTLSAVFQTYFHILKHTTETSLTGTDVSSTHSSDDGFGEYLLLAPCLNGLERFSHLIDLDYMGDLMNSLKNLAIGGSNLDSTCENSLTVSERLGCCIVAFKVMRSNLDALNVDLHEFLIQLYNLMLEYRPGRDQGEVLAEALKTMLCEGRHHDTQRAAAFIKRLAAFSLCYGSAEAMAALVTLKGLLKKNIKCRNLLENAGGGSLSVSDATYQPYASNPDQSGALASVLWELSLLSNHYHPKISTAASSISSLSAGPNQAYLYATTPQQAFKDLSIEHESFKPKGTLGTSSRKKRKVSESSITDSTSLEPIQNAGNHIDEEDLKNKISEHFNVLRDITENKKLRKDLNHTGSSIRLYEGYKRQKK